MNEMGMPDDGKLVAYLDGELDETERRALAARLERDAALRARFAELAAGGRPFREAFDLLLDSAPAGRLEAGLARAIGARPSRRPSYRYLAALAAALVLFVLGGVAGHFLPLGSGGATENWRAVVAEYLTLYTNETLADIPDDAAAKRDELSRVGARLGLDLAADKVAVAGLDLKRAQLFNLDGMPLAQIAYLSAKDGPVAFCIIRDGEADAAPDFETRDGKNIVYWTKGGHAFMLIGNAARPDLEALAGQLAAKVS